MTPKITDDEIPEMIEECIQWAEARGKDDTFFRSLEEWYEEKEFLTKKQYDALCDWYEKVLFNA